MHASTPALLVALRTFVAAASVFAGSQVGAQVVNWQPTTVGTLAPNITQVQPEQTITGLGFNSVSRITFNPGANPAPLELAFGDAEFIVVTVPGSPSPVEVRTPFNAAYRMYILPSPVPAPGPFGPNDAIDVELKGPGGIFPSAPGSSQVNLVISSGTLRLDASRTIDNPLVGTIALNQLASIAPNLDTFFYYRPSLVFGQVAGATLPAGLVVELEVRADVLFVPEPSAAAAAVAALALLAGLYRRRRLAPAQA